MRQRPSSHKRNSKSLLSTTIEQIKRDLNGEYNETPLNNNFLLTKKKLNKKNFVCAEEENEKTNYENNANINYNNINISKLKNKNKKILNISTTNSNLNSNEKNNSNESILQNQINDLKIKSQNMKDKLIIFLKLMKKYSFKLTTLTKNNSRNNNSQEKKSVIDKEIKSTLSQLNKMLNNPKLNEDIFDIPDLTINNITTINDEMVSLTNQLNTNPNNIVITTNPTLSNNCNKIEENNINNTNIIATEINSGENDDLKNEYVKDIEGLIDKYEEKITLLKNENNTLKQTSIEQNNYVNSLLFEVNELKDKLNQEKKNYEKNLIKLNNDSITLQKKVDLLQDENSILKKNCVELSQNLEKNDVNNMTNIEKELQHKNNVIKYLENVLRNSGINLSNYNYITNNDKNNEIKFSKTKNDYEIDINNFNNKKNEENNKQYFTFYKINQKSINTSKNNEIRNSRESNTFSPKILQQEIDDIDKEIVDLQKQLKHLLNE